MICHIHALAARPPVSVSNSKDACFRTHLEEEKMTKNNATAEDPIKNSHFRIWRHDVLSDVETINMPKM
jgi:hypothetical protein